MKARCANISDPDYGGRGIKVCAQWVNSFATFLADMGPRPASRHTIERVNNDHGYSPENCIWATRKEQSANQRVRANRVYVDGIPLKEAAEQMGVKYNTLHRRVRRKLMDQKRQ